MKHHTKALIATFLILSTVCTNSIFSFADNLNIDPSNHMSSQISNIEETEDNDVVMVDTDEDFFKQDNFLSENLIDNAEKRGIQLREGISGLSNPLFESVRGQGLLNAIVLTKPCAHAAMQWALEHGLIINAPSPDVLRLAPPLIVSEEEMNEAIKILSSMPEYLEQD